MLNLQTMRIQCKCQGCAEGDPAAQSMSGIDFCKHSGKHQCRSWRSSVIVTDGIHEGALPTKDPIPGILPLYGFENSLASIQIQSYKFQVSSFKDPSFPLFRFRELMQKRSRREVPRLSLQRLLGEESCPHGPRQLHVWLLHATWKHCKWTCCLALTMKLCGNQLYCFSAWEAYLRIHREQIMLPCYCLAEMIITAQSP